VRLASPVACSYSGVVVFSDAITLATAKKRVPLVMLKVFLGDVLKNDCSDHASV
jgi:hypothetical protein